MTHALAGRPISLIRLGRERGVWVLDSQQMRSVSETGDLGDRSIQLNKPRKSEEGDTDGADALLNGYPGETIALGEDHAAVLITNQYGSSLHRVALLDLGQFRLDTIVATMSPSEIAKLRTGRLLTALALAAAEGAAEGAVAGAMGTYVSPLFFPLPMPNGLANEVLAARPDGQFLYALDKDIHAVTVIDIRAATVLRRISVDRSVARIQVSSDGKDLLCVGKATQEIDLNSNDLVN